MEPDEVKPWLAVVERDLRAARNCLFGPEPTTEAAAYHCQQAAEKLVKAALVSQGLAVPFSHDLRLLLKQLPQTWPLKPLLQPLARLTPYATAYRYPLDDPFSAPPVPEIAEVEQWVSEITQARQALMASLTL